MLEGQGPDPLDLLLRITGETVDRHDRLQPEVAHDPEVPSQVGRSHLDRADPALGLARVMLERLDRGDENDRVGTQLARATDDVEELLHAHVGAEATLRDDVVAELQRDPVGDQRVVAVRDVRERPAVNERGLSFERLHEVRLDRLLQQDGHRSRCTELLRRHRLAVERLRNRDRGQSPPQIEEIRSDRDDRHHFGRSGDVEPGLADIAVHAAAEPDGDVTQRAVVDVHAAAPADRQRIDAERVAVQDVRLDHRRQQVVRGADRVDVTGEVEVHVLHRDHLRVAAAGCAALDPEDRSQRGLPQAQHRLLPDVPESLRQRDGRRGLSLAGLRRRDRRDVDQLRVGVCRQAVEDGQVDLRLEAPVEVDLLRQQTEVGRQFVDRSQHRALGDLERRGHRLRGHARPLVPA